MLHVHVLIILHCVPCNNDVYTYYCTVLRANDANSSRDSRKGIARTSQTCRNVRVARMSQSRRATVAKTCRNVTSRVYICCKVGARPSQRHGIARRDIPAMPGRPSRPPYRRYTAQDGVRENDASPLHINLVLSIHCKW